MSTPEEDLGWPALFDRVYEGDAEGEAYHGRAVRRTLDGVSERTASARPIADAHSIVELVIHLATWREWLCGVLAGDKRAVEDDGWTRVETLTSDAWRAALERLDASAERLRRALRDAPPAVLEAQASRIRFVLHHDVHHGGQIALLRRAVLPGARPAK